MNVGPNPRGSWVRSGAEEFDREVEALRRGGVVEVSTVATTTAPSSTTSPTTTTTTTTVPYVPPPTTTTTAADVTYSLATLEAALIPAFEQELGRSPSLQEVEQFGQREYGCREFTP